MLGSNRRVGCQLHAEEPAIAFDHRRGQRLPEEQVLRWITQALLALKYIHAPRTQSAVCLNRSKPFQLVESCQSLFVLCLPVCAVFWEGWAERKRCPKLFPVVPPSCARKDMFYTVTWNLGTSSFAEVAIWRWATLELLRLVDAMDSSQQAPCLVWHLSETGWTN